MKMNSVLLLLSLSASLHLSAAVYCSECLKEVWRQAVTYNHSAELCYHVTVDQILSCLDICDRQGVDRPESFKIRQLTQISDIFKNMKLSSCSWQSASCTEMLTCLEPVTDYSIPVAPYVSVFNFSCRQSNFEAADSCLQRVGSGCSSSQRVAALRDILLRGVDAGCNEPRRCISYGVIYETVPGSGCNKVYQEAAAYGPSVGAAVQLAGGLKFDTSACRPEYPERVVCAPDPEGPQIFTENPPPLSTTLTLASYPAVTVNISLSCNACLQPVWQRAVTTNGSHLCDVSFTGLAQQCIDACISKEVAFEQQYIEQFIKTADIYKALSMNGCSTAACSGDIFQCLNSLVNFEPISAPHTTVNNLNCRADNAALNTSIQCLKATCPAWSANLVDLVTRGYKAICKTTRCMSYGNIYDLVPLREVPKETVPCANYLQGQATRWVKSAVLRVQPGLVFNTNLCRPEWPDTFSCPGEITAP